MGELFGLLPSAQRVWRGTRCVDWRDAGLISIPYAGRLALQEKPEVLKEIGDFLSA